MLCTSVSTDACTQITANSDLLPLLPIRINLFLDLDAIMASLPVYNRY